jgi:hypothetical protein
MGFESTIPTLERAKTVHALDPAAIVIGFSRVSSCAKFPVHLTLLDLITILVPNNLTNYADPQHSDFSNLFIRSKYSARNPLFIRN